MTSRPPPTTARLALGFLVAPVVVPLLHAAIELGLPRQGPPGYVRALLAHAIATVVSSTTPVAYGLALAIGIPLVFALRSAGRLTVPWLVASSAAASAAASLVPLAFVVAGGIVEMGPVAWLGVPAVAAVVAALVAAAFCAVAGVPLRAAISRPSP